MNESKLKCTFLPAAAGHRMVKVVVVVVVLGGTILKKFSLD